MGDDVNPVDEAKAYRWRPAVSPYRPRGISRIRSRKPLAGQMLLPGIESAEQSSPAGETLDTEARPPDALPAHDDGHADTPGLACPNCGSTQFDEDGDCIHCWEPGVVGTDTPPNAREG